MVESKIAVFNSIRIKHRNNLKYEQFSQNDTRLALAHQKLNNALSKKGRSRFRRMHASSKQYNWIVF